jgi:AhpD family alkylhydroperoxidase
MSDTHPFPRLSVETAPHASRPLLQASAKQFGFLPSPLAYAAGSPALLRQLLAGFAAFDQTSLTHAEREVVAMTVAFEQGCHYCMALHSALLAEKPELAPLVSALRSGSELPDAKLEALRVLVKAILNQRGRIPSSSLQSFLAAGFSQQAALDALLGTSVYITSTLINLVTEAELDPPFQAFRWERPT